MTTAQSTTNIETSLTRYTRLTLVCYPLMCSVKTKTKIVRQKGTQNIYFLRIVKQNIYLYTVNPLYTNTRYNDKSRYNDNLYVPKASLNRWRLMRNYAKTRSFLYVILSIKDSLQQQNHYKGNIFGNKCCRFNEGSQYPLIKSYVSRDILPCNIGNTKCIEKSVQTDQSLKTLWILGYPQSVIQRNWIRLRRQFA